MVIIEADIEVPFDVHYTDTILTRIAFISRRGVPTAASDFHKYR